MALVGALFAHLVLLGGASLLPPVRSLFEGEGGRGADLELVDVEVDEPLAKGAPTVGPTEAEAPPPRPDAIPETRAPHGAVERHVRSVEPSRRAAPSGADQAAPGRDASPVDASPRPFAGPSHRGDDAASAGSPREQGPRDADAYDTPTERPALPRVGAMLGAPAWTVPGAIAPVEALPAPTAAPARAPVDPDVANRVIASTLRSRGKKAFVDVPAASVIAGTVATTMRSVAVPHNTRATFEVSLGPGGKLLGTRVLSSSGGDAAQWDAAAKSVAASLSKRALALGPDADRTGATVKVTVTQKHVLPSGTTKGADLRPKCANGFINDIIDAADKAPRADTDPKVPLFQDEHGRPCIPVGVAGVSDLANIGAQKQIQVESSFQVVIPGQADLPAEIHEVNTEAPWIERGKEGPRPTLPQSVRKYLRDKEKKK